MLAGDSRGAWDNHVLDDPRVVSLWDQKRIAGRWFADHKTGGIETPGNIAWDAYYAFPANSQWRDQPTNLITAGSTIIDNSDQLSHHLAPLLR